VTRGQEFVVGGWLPGNGRLEGRLGSLLVGYHHDDGGFADRRRRSPSPRGRPNEHGPGGPLHYAGRVGSGIDERARKLLEERLAPLARDDSPFEADAPRIKDMHFVDPQVVVAVEFYEWTSVGVLRAPRYKGRRDDVDPDTVIREP